MTILDQKKASLASLKSSQSQLVQTCLSDVDKFCREAPVLLVDWLRSCLDRTIAAHSETILEMGPDKIKPVKEEFEALCSSIPASLAARKEQLAELTRKYSILVANRFDGSKLNPDVLDSEARSIVSKIASVLDKHQLLNHNDVHFNEWRSTGRGTFEYASNPGWSEALNSIITSYSNALKKAQELNGDIGKLEKELSELQAKQLWSAA